MPARIRHDARDAADVFDGVVKQHQIHRDVGFVVLDQGSLQRIANSVESVDSVDSVESVDSDESVERVDRVDSVENMPEKTGQ